MSEMTNRNIDVETNSANDKLSLEDTLKQIEQIIFQMESPEVTLEESFGLYQNGVEKMKACNEMLDEVEKKMLVLNGNGELEEF